MAKKAIANVTMKVRIGDNEIEVSGPSDYVEKKIKEALENQKGPLWTLRPVASESESVRTTIPSVLPQMTLNEFYRKYVHKIKSRPTIAVFLLYYLERMRKKDKIQTADVLSCFKEIHYPNWNNLNMTDILTSAKRRALVNYVNKLWSLTTTGEDYVLNMVSGKSK
jgi:predicted metal-dependent hydrolase